ncbi:MAG: penicillin acylase family protein [Desulfobacter sp.]|nr:MAG: penicillin acylase family protein [Desulfobacter sp.]
MGKTMSDAMAYLSDQMGKKTENWTWGKIHTLRLEHPLGKVRLLDAIFKFNDSPKEMGGSFHTVCPLAYKLSEPFVINHGASHRHIYTPANWDDSVSVIPTGTSGIPASPHYCDQTDLYVNNQYHKDLFSLEKIIAHKKYALELNPAD